MGVRPVAVAVLGALAGLHAWLAAGVFAPAEGGGVAGLAPPAWLLPPLMALGGLAASRWWPDGWPVLLLALPGLPSPGWVMGAAWPAAAMWAGGLTWLAWALLAGAVAVRGVQWLSMRVGQHVPDGRGWRVRCGPLAAAAIGGAWMTLVAAGLDPAVYTGDEPHYLLVGESLRRDGDLDLRNNYDDRHYAAFYAGDLEPRHVVSGWLGEQFSYHAPGAGLLALPALAAGGATLVRPWFVLLAATALGLFWSTAFRLTGLRSAAWMGWAALALPAPLAIHGSRVYPDAPAALAVVAALWLLVSLRDGHTPSSLALVAVGAALTTLPWLHLRTAFLAGALGLAIVLALGRTAERWSARAVFLAVPAIGMTLWVALTWQMFRVTDPTAPFRARDAGRPWSDLPMGVLGMLADQEFGLLPYAPVMVLAVPGFAALQRMAPIAAVAGGAILAGTLALGGVFAWWGGTSAPARFLVPVLPAAALAASAWWIQASPMARAIGRVLALISALVTIAVAFARDGSLAVQVPDGRGTVFEWLSPHVDMSLALPSLFRAGTVASTETTVALVWALAGVMCAWGCARVWTPSRPDVAACWGTAAVGCAVWISISAGLAWSWRNVTPATPSRAILDAIHAAPARRLSTGVSSGPWALVSRDDAVSRLVLRMGRTADGETQLDVPGLPAGQYLVMAGGRPGPVPGAWQVEVGGEAWPLAGWSPSSPRSASVALAVPVSRLRIVGSPADAWLRPLSIPVAAAPPAFEAWRVHRWGRRQVYERDHSAEVHSGGLWLRGDRITELIVSDLDARATSSAIGLEAGPAAVRVRLELGNWHRDVRLAPGARARVDVPAPATANAGAPVPLRLDVQGGFRADVLSPGRRDDRLLGVFVTFDE